MYNLTKTEFLETSDIEFLIFIGIVIVFFVGGIIIDRWLK